LKRGNVFFDSREEIVAREGGLEGRRPSIGRESFRRPNLIPYRGGKGLAAIVEEKKKNRATALRRGEKKQHGLSPRKISIIL